MNKSIYSDMLVQKLVQHREGTTGFYALGHEIRWDEVVLAAAELGKAEIEVRKVLRKALEEIRSSSETQYAKAYLRFKLVTEAWQYDLEHQVKWGESRGAHVTRTVRQGLHSCFFSQGIIFLLYDRLLSKGFITVQDQQTMEKLAQDILHLGERDTNNRAFFYAIGHALAAKHFPHLQAAKEWKAYAEAVWYDWYGPGDCYEPGYVAHNIAWVIELGTILGKDEELKSDKALKAFMRYRDHISPSGLAIQPGDGGTQSAYVEALSVMAKLTRDGTFLWAAQQAFLAGEYGGYKGNEAERVPENKKEEALKARFGEFDHAGIQPHMPDGGCCNIQELYPATYRIPDRLLLNPSREPGSPYCAFYLNDRVETLHHGNEDNRGELYHYEVDGVLYLKRSSWHKWAAQTNTFVVDDAQAEYPFCYTQGLLKNRWYKAMTNMRLLRDFVGSERYVHLTERPESFSHISKERKIKDETDMPLPRYYKDVQSPYGVFLSNPEGMAGKTDNITIRSITLSINTFAGSGDFHSSAAWYRDERKHLAKSGGRVAMVIDSLFMAGAKGKKVLLDFETIPENLTVIYYEAGKMGTEQEKRILSKDEVRHLLQLTEDGDAKGKTLKITCLPGRMDLLFHGFSELVDLTEDYSWLGFDYKYLDDVREYKRTPVKIFVNGMTCRSMYVDHQQGGILKSSMAEQKEDDCYGEMLYEGVYTYDSAWKRCTLLTKEGYLVVVDEFTPGKEAEGMAGGPVWQMKTVPQQGISWFDAVVEERLNRSLMIYFHPQAGHTYGAQYQPKLWVGHEYAVFDKAIFEEGRKEVYITVMLPHDSGIPLGEENHGITTSLSKEGAVMVKIQPVANGELQPLELNIQPSWSWEVIR